MADVRDRHDLMTVKATLNLSEEEIKSLPAEKIFYRTERQTLRRLPKSGAIVFGIKTYQMPLTVLRGKPKECQKFIEAIERMDKVYEEYHESHLWKDNTLNFLRQQLEQQTSKL